MSTQAAGPDWLERCAGVLAAAEAGRSRPEKRRILAEYLRSFSGEGLAPAVAFLAGGPFPRADGRTLSVGGARLARALLAACPGLAPEELEAAWLRHSDAGDTALRGSVRDFGDARNRELRGRRVASSACVRDDFSPVPRPVGRPQRRAAGHAWRSLGARGIVAALLVAAWPGQGAGGELRVEVVARGLEVPWALAFAPDGPLFVTERPGRVRAIKDGQLAPAPVATLQVAHVGEGGLMGLALDPAFGQNGHLYVCYTASTGPRLFGGGLVNRVARLTVRGGSAGDARALLDNLPGASIHDGCRLKFGPDGKLYVTTGDAAEPRLAQRMDSLAGKILRLNADGSVPPDNPFPGSPIYSLGHRNPQGIAWDGRGRLFAAEHGPSGHDEVNHILPGRNYGWPEVAGQGGAPRYADPLVESGSDTWAPSGIAVLGSDLYVAGLRGRRLLRVRLGPDLKVAGVEALLAGTYGRLRDVVVGPDGALYVTTSNRDGRGSPAPDDDRILRLTP